jgi:hypothetical protein
MPAPPDRKPDAAIYPHNMLTGELELRLEAAKLLFGPVLGCRRVSVRNQDGFNFATPFRRPHVVETLTYPVAHPLAKRDRYDWYRADFDKKTRKFTLTGDLVDGPDDHRGSILFGWLKEDPHETDADVLAEVEGDIGRHPTAKAKARAAERQEQVEEAIERIEGVPVRLDAEVKEKDLTKDQKKQP